MRRTVSVTFLALFCAGFLAAAPLYRYREADLAQIARVAVQTLVEHHYRGRPLGPELSRALFDEYFKTLDPAHVFFTREEIDRFSGSRDQVSQQLQNGDASFGFQAYELYRKRVGEFRRFAEKTLQTPFDFTVDESWIIDRSKEPFPADDAERAQLWRKKLKNDVLYFRLLKRAMDSGAVTDEKRTAAFDLAPEERVLRRLRDLDNDVRDREKIEILGIYLDTLARVFGPHSGYDSPSREEDFDIHMKLSLSGIGATLTNDGGFVKIVSIVPGGPAARDGNLQIDDRIISVTQENGETVDLIDMPISKAVRHIRGPVGSRVTLTVLPAEQGKSAMPRTLTIVREKIDLVDSAAKGEVREIEFNGSARKIGVLTLPGFYLDFEGFRRHDPDARRCSVDVRRILEDFNAAKVDAVVVDLRRNGGGSLPEAITLAGLFFRSGPVVQVRDRDRDVGVLRDPDPECIYAGPLVVLTSKLSASASEIFASALKDCNRALIVGDSRTFGKGTVLEVLKLEPYPAFFGKTIPAGSLTCENAMFFRTSGASVQQLGLASDIRLPSFSEEMEIGEMFMDNHLPWDSIRPVTRPGYGAVTPEKIRILAKHSAERIAASPEYGKMLEQIALVRSRRERKEVSLNEEIRYREYLEEKRAADEADKVLSDADATDKKSSDPVLDESVNIAADFSLMQ
ncbi:MAG: carboxy terminal-processing peptidase [Victivallaceae bacterium]|nr:carboxy terminal-processing peptidase [Victivallaceae bacterium]